MFMRAEVSLNTVLSSLARGDEWQRVLPSAAVLRLASAAASKQDTAWLIACISSSFSARIPNVWFC